MILITAPTSQIGSQVVTRLLERNVDLRVIVRDPERLDPDVRTRVEVVTGSHGDAALIERAAEGVEAAFWLTPNDPSAPTVEATFVDFARPAASAFAEKGVERVVGVSALGRGTRWEKTSGFVTASLEMDDLFARSGIPYRAVVNPSFMDNLLNGARTIREEGFFSLPVPGDLGAPSVATKDIAATSADLLMAPGWTGFDEVACLGPRDLTPEEMAEIISEVLDRPIAFRPTSPEAFGERMKSFGMSEPFAQAYVDMFRAKAEGMDNALPRTEENTTPTTFREFVGEVLAPAVKG
jgi:uncharacterized protein YbjT (DUF2867 family)